jgi:hypothetical protein
MGGGHYSKTGKPYPNQAGVSDAEYHRNRRARAKEKGVCTSHLNRKAVVGRTRCQECLDSFDKFAKDQKAAGLCISHKNVLAVKGKSYCEECLLNKRILWLKTRGMTEAESLVARDAWIKFDGRCWGCGTSDPGTKGWTLDHNHLTMKFRGILCSGCNLALGHLKDSVIRLMSLLVYLKKPSGENDSV